MSLVPQLPITSIKAANTTWMRQDLGDMEALTADVRAHGVKKPILVATDYLMLDGTRRLLAAEAAGHTYVPVIICQSWKQLCTAIEPNGPDTYPMRWDELHDLWLISFKAVHQPERYTTAAARARGKKKPAPPRTSHYSVFTEAVAQMYGQNPASIKILRDSFSMMRRIQAQYPWFVKGLEVAIQTMPPEQRHISKSRILKNAMTQLLKFEGDPKAQQDLLTDAARKLHQADPRGPIFFGRQHHTERYKPRDNAPLMPVQAVVNLVDMLTAMATEAAKFQNFKAQDPAVLRRCSATIRNDMDIIYRFRRRLDAYLEHTFGEETNKEQDA